MILLWSPLYFCGFFGLKFPEYAINKNKPYLLFRVASRSIRDFIEAINEQGGISLSNGYDVEFSLPSLLAGRIKEETEVDFANTSPTDRSKLLTLMCDEAQLPNVQSATGTVTGRYLGESQFNYAHTRMYSDLSLTWMCDGNMIPLKFFNSWYSYIYSANESEENDRPVNEFTRKLSKFKSELGTPKNRNRNIRLNYPEDYMATMKIVKTERSVNAPNGRPSMMYLLEDCYPYSIDSVPLAYGSSQITRVSVNFYYAKHTVVYNEIANFEG